MSPDDGQELGPVRAMDDLRVGNGHHRVRSEGIAQSGERHVEVQPVQARASGDQAVRARELSILRTPNDPPEAAVGTTR